MCLVQRGQVAPEVLDGDGRHGDLGQLGDEFPLGAGEGGVGFCAAGLGGEGVEHGGLDAGERAGEGVLRGGGEVCPFLVDDVEGDTLFFGQ